MKQAVVIGLAQMVAVLPGISRSGSTICTGIFAGVKREAAAAFSFLLALPAIGGAGLLELMKLLKAHGDTAPTASPALLVTGLIVSALTSFGALAFLTKLVRNGKLALFSWYLFAAGAAVLVWQLLKVTRGI